MNNEINSQIVTHMLNQCTWEIKYARLKIYMTLKNGMTVVILKTVITIG